MRRMMSLIGMILISATMLFAQGPGPGNQRQMRARGPMARREIRGAILRQLDLTEAQKTQISNIKAQNFAATQGVREQLRAERRAMRPAEPGAPFDEQAFRAHALKMANLRVELQVAHAKTRNAIYNALTPEQKAKLQDFRTKMQERMKAGRVL